MPLQRAEGLQVNEGVSAILDDLITAGMLLAAKVHLYKSSFAPNADSTYADFLAAECDYTGYASTVLTWSAIGTDTADSPTSLSNRAFFQATDAVAPNVVGGVFITFDVTGPPAEHTVVGYFPLIPTVNLTTALAFLGIVVAAQIPGTPGYVIADN